MFAQQKSTFRDEVLDDLFLYFVSLINKLKQHSNTLREKKKKAWSDFHKVSDYRHFSGNLLPDARRNNFHTISHRCDTHTILFHAAWSPSLCFSSHQREPLSPLCHAPRPPPPYPSALSLATPTRDLMMNSWPLMMMMMDVTVPRQLLLRSGDRGAANQGCCLHCLRWAYKGH